MPLASSCSSGILVRGFDRGIPVLVGLSVDESPHVEPRGRVALRRIFRILDLARHDDGDQVAIGQNCYDFGGQLVAGWRSRPRPEKPDDAFTA